MEALRKLAISLTTTHDFQSAPKSAAKDVAASKPRTLLDAVNEAAGVNCNLLAGDRCRHIGPLISVYCLPV